MMFGGSSFSFLAIPLLIGAIMTGLRFWMFYAGTSAIRSSRLGRINDSDAHLSFDERIAERLRQLERQQGAGQSDRTPLLPPTPGGFGRRRP